VISVQRWLARAFVVLVLLFTALFYALFVLSMLAPSLPGGILTQP
jgi:hypothetical protein